MVAFSRRGLELISRADLTAPPDQIAEVLASAMKRFSRLRCVMLLAYGPPEVADATMEVADGLQSRGFPVVETLRVADGHYHCLQCECTPSSGAPFDAVASPIAAAATVNGWVAMPDRESVDKLVRPIGGLAAIAMSQAVDRAEQRMGSIRDNSELVSIGVRLVDEMMGLARNGQRLDDDQVAWLSLLINDHAVRDQAWAQSDDEQWQLDFWLDLTRRADPILAAPFATMLGWCAWRKGNGVLANAALERAHRIDPCYSLANSLLTAVNHALPPSVMGTWPPPDWQLGLAEEGVSSDHCGTAERFPRVHGRGPDGRDLRASS